MNVSTKMIQTKISVALVAQVKNSVNQGWFLSLDDVLLNVLRRYLDSHRAD